MRRFLACLGAFILILTAAAVASACPIPFQISGGDLDVTWTTGGGIVSYDPLPMDEPIWLAEGESQRFTFGTVHIPRSLGTGEATFEVFFENPDADGVVSDTGVFSVFSLIFFTFGKLEFGDPAQFAYSYDGLTGGLMQVDFFDQIGFQGGTDVLISGAITNIQNPVPEPATLLLLGTGLVGLAGIGRKKFFKKS